MILFKRLLARPSVVPWLDCALVLVLAVSARSLPFMAGPWMRSIFFDLGPNDREYVSGFREGWEREGDTRFHWTTLSSTIALPVRLVGDGFRLRMRVRRHFSDPAHVRLSVEGRTFFEFDIRADPHVAYPIVEATLPPLHGRHAFVVSLDAKVDNPRPLGLAMDWIEIAGQNPSDRIALLPDTEWRMLGLLVSVFLLVRLAGGRRLTSFSAAAGLLLCLFFGMVADTLAFERVLRLGWSVTLVSTALAAIIVRAKPLRRAFAIEPADPRGLLVALVFAAVFVRLWIILHPRFYYPDVTVHGLLLSRLNRLGLTAFLERYIEFQFDFSLGLQMENSHWYAFPYPPALYLLCWPISRLGGFAYDVAVSILPAAVNSLEILIVYAISRRLGMSSGIGALSASFMPLFPLFIARLSYAYFPAIVGHAFDAALVLLIITRLDRTPRLVNVLTLGLVFAAAMLTYTQSILNLAVLLTTFAVLDFLAVRSWAAVRRQAALLLAVIIGASLSFTLFYERYAPVMVSLYRGTPMPEASIKIEKDRIRAARLTPEELAPENDDPDAGPDFNPWRGVRKAGRRLYRFYGPYAPFVIMGFWLLIRRLDGSQRRLVIAWGMTYVTLNLLSGGLPGPNLVRYNKDLEIVAPLACLSLSMVAAWLWSRARVLALIYWTGFMLFGVVRALVYLTEKFAVVR